ncbi:cobalt-factor II C(20)-methyltransferase [Desulfotomaculum varum]
MKGIFYGIGVGPGDPELLTLKAARLLQSIDAVIAPRTGTKTGSTALQIARPHLRPEAQILELTFPMVDNSEEKTNAWEKNKQVILSLLAQDKRVAFLTLGDPMLYSTYIYMIRLLARHQVNCQTVPGITSFCAAAGRAGFPLAEGDEILTVIPATCDREKLNQALAVSDNVVLMKVSRQPAQLVELMQRHNLTEQAVMVSKCGHADESVLCQINKDIKPVYLSTILAKKTTGM